MRHIHRMIFLGSAAAIDDINKLRNRLKEALNILSGLQQPDHAESEEDARMMNEERLNFEQELKDAVADLVAAFGYDPSDLTYKQLPY